MDFAVHTYPLIAHLVKADEEKNKIAGIVAKGIKVTNAGKAVKISGYNTKDYAARTTATAALLSELIGEYSEGKGINLNAAKVGGLIKPLGYTLDTTTGKITNSTKFVPTKGTYDDLGWSDASIQTALKQKEALDALTGKIGSLAKSFKKALNEKKKGATDGEKPTKEQMATMKAVVVSYTKAFKIGIQEASALSSFMVTLVSKAK